MRDDALRSDVSKEIENTNGRTLRIGAANQKKCTQDFLNGALLRDLRTKLLPHRAEVVFSFCARALIPRWLRLARAYRVDAKYVDLLL